MFRRCIYNKDAHEYVFDYSKQFLNAYKNDKKILMLNFMDMHEGTFEVINYLDKPLAKFLNEINNEDTSIIMFSDHGPHLGGLKKNFGGVQASTEQYNPFIFTANLHGLPQEH